MVITAGHKTRITRLSKLHGGQGRPGIPDSIENRKSEIRLWPGENI